MLRLTLAFSLLALAPRPTLAQGRQPSPDSTVIPGRGVPLYSGVKLALTIQRLPSLHTGPAAATRTEVRLWDGFGLTGIGLFIAREDSAGRWRFWTLEPPLEDRRGRLRRLRPDSTWTIRWRAALAAGLLELPPGPRRAPSDYFVSDGYSAIIETWIDGRYHAAGADNPAAYCSADDQRFMTVLHLLGGPELQCRGTAGQPSN